MPPPPPKTLPSSCPDPHSLQRGAVSLLGTLPLPGPVLAREVICDDVCGKGGHWVPDLPSFSMQR